MFSSRLMFLFRMIMITMLVAGFSQAQPAAARAAGAEMPNPAASPAAAVDGLPTDQIIIHYKDGLSGVSIQAAGESQRRRLSEAAGTELTYERAISGGAHVMRLTTRLPLDRVQAMASRLAALPEVAYAEPDEIKMPALIPNDTYYATYQWDLVAPTAGNYGINMPAAWDLTTGSSSVVVAVVDTGILNHADLSGRTVAGYDFISDSDIANDGDERDDDPSDPGDWITAAESASGYFVGCPVSDSSWHGTHVSGTIGAASNNSQGVAGINWNSRILPVRVLGKCGGYTSDIVDGMRWAAGLTVSDAPANPNPAKVINLSLGGAGTCGTTWQTAIDAITAAGTTVVVAAGNNNANAANYSPASCNNVITVAATDRNGSRSYYSNYGSVVEISAPGGDVRVSGNNGILSTLNDGVTTPGSDIYAFYQGTSMAAPHVAGVVSLLYSINPSLTPTQVLGILQSNVTAFPGGSTCNTSTCGSGIMNAGLAAAAVSPPLAILHASPAATGSGNCDSWANACTLQTALATAASGAEIWVMEGTHRPSATGSRAATFQLKNGVAVYGGFAGTETARSQRNFATHVTNLSGDLSGNDNNNVMSNEPTRAENSYHVVTGSVVDSTAVLDGFTITGGNAETDQGCPGTGCGAGMENTSGSPTVTNVIFSANAAYVNGGAMSNMNGSNPSLTSVTFDHNTAQVSAGGAIFNHTSNPTLVNAAFSNNWSYNQGGAIYNHASSPSLTNVTFWNNSSTNWGGAIYNYSLSNPALTNVTFAENAAANGGGIYNNSNCVPVLNNVTFTGNSASQNGAAINIQPGSGVTIHNGILWGNGISNFGGSVTISDSIVEGGCPSASSCTNLITANPLLGPLGNYGGGAQTIALLPGSSAINTGNAGYCPARDQRGLNRVGTCDIGAFESQGFTLSVTGGNNQSTNVYTAFANPLRVGVAANNTGEPVNGGVVTFTAPSSGASVIGPDQDITIASGSAAASETANSVGGSYQVSAGAAGAPPVYFNLTNVSIPLPTVQFSSGTYSVNEDGGTATITVTLSAAYPETVSVQYASSDGTARAGSDYTATGGTLTFSTGQTSRTFTVPITDDALDETNETISLALSAPANATLGAPSTATLTIVDDDVLPTIQFSSGTYSVDEDGGTATITVTLSSVYPEPVSVEYATSNGTAVAGSDYSEASGSLTFNPGITSQSFTIAVQTDDIAEEDETILLTLSNPSNATLGPTNTAILTILANAKEYDIYLPTVMR